MKYDGLNMLTSPVVTSNVFAPNTLENNTGLLSGSDVILQGWGQHTVAASFTFDGVNASNGTSLLACHVTGIPLHAAPPSISGPNAWTKSAGTIKIENGCLRLSNGDGKASARSANFYIPPDSVLPVNVSTKATANPNKSTIGTTFKLSLGTTVLFSATAKDMEWVVHVLIFIM